MRCFDGCRSCVLADLSGPGKRLVVMNYVGRGVSRAAVTVLYVEGLMLDPMMCDMPHVQVTIVSLQLSSKVAESV